MWWLHQRSIFTCKYKLRFFVSNVAVLSIFSVHLRLCSVIFDFVICLVSIILLALIRLHNHLNNSKVPFQTLNIIFLNPSFNKQDLDFFYLIIFISSSSLELLGSQMLHSVTFWCVNTSILLTTAIINGSIYVITFCFGCLKFVSDENGTSRTSF
ncbi:hypothetical protein Hanom_Chr12g01099131 [Helianthus anomalus]